MCWTLDSEKSTSHSEHFRHLLIYASFIEKRTKNNQRGSTFFIQSIRVHLQSSKMEALEIVDFKSFSGIHKLENLGKFVTVVGTNGAGKQDIY